MNLKRTKLQKQETCHSETPGLGKGVQGFPQEEASMPFKPAHWNVWKIQEKTGLLQTKAFVKQYILLCFLKIFQSKYIKKGFQPSMFFF